MTVSYMYAWNFSVQAPYFASQEPEVPWCTTDVSQEAELHQVFRCWALPTIFCLRAQGKMFGKLEDIDLKIQVLASQKFLDCHMCHEIILNWSKAVNIMLGVSQLWTYKM